MPSMMNVWRQRGAGAAQSDPGKPCFGERDQKEVIHFCTVFMGVDNGVDNGSPPRLPHGHDLFEEFATYETRWYFPENKKNRDYRFVIAPRDGVKLLNSKAMKQ